MGYRIVKINNRCKLETRLNYLVCVTDHETKILLNEISILIIENQQVCITNALLTELIKHKIKVIFCDEKHNPISELNSYYESYDTYKKIKCQISWKQEIKDRLWAIIIKQKILNQAEVLFRLEKFDCFNLLRNYANEITIGDSTNREGLSAKMYFNALFDNNFDRKNKNDIRNIFLNYGYSLILSTFNKEIAAYGYLTQLGIHHIGETNPFNFSCDLMEPFRPFVDYLILSCKELNENNYKNKLLELLTSDISYNNRNTIMLNAINFYVLSAVSVLNNENIRLLDNPKFKDE